MVDAEDLKSSEVFPRAGSSPAPGTKEVNFMSQGRRGLPVIALVGRPNVGKSTLFNRLIGWRKAIVDDTPGVTRDRIYGVVKKDNEGFVLIDTGGIIPGEDTFGIQQQVEMAVNEADLLVMVIDARTGITPLDQEVATLLRKSGKPIIVAANKIDTQKHSELALTAYELGFEDIVPISAEHARGINDLWDAFRRHLDLTLPDASERSDRIRVAVLGRPNVGKSTLINTILDEDRVLVSSVPGTTRDPVDIDINIGGVKYTFVDTAGLRRKSKIRNHIEYYSIIRSLKAVESADVVVLLLDGLEGPTEQDKKLAGHVLQRGKGLILAINKNDLIKHDDTYADLDTTVKDEFFFVRFAPIIRISAKTGERIEQLLELIDSVYQNLHKRITTSQLNRFLQEVIQQHPPTTKGVKRIRINYITQAATNPPLIVAFANHPDAVPASYKRYILSRFYEWFGFEGVPIKLILKKKNPD